MTRAISLGWKFFPGDGTLDIILAGRPGRGYNNPLAGFQWDNFYHRLGGGHLLAAMRDDTRRNYDYTLIDSRTGLSDIAGICTVRFPGTVVNCFTLSTQSIEGAASVAQSIGEQRDRDIRILPVPMRVEDGEQNKLENGRALARSSFSGFPRNMSTFGDEPGWPTPCSRHPASARTTRTSSGDGGGAGSAAIWNRSRSEPQPADRRQARTIWKPASPRMIGRARIGS
jgi:hypothetical protein